MKMRIRGDLKVAWWEDAKLGRDMSGAPETAEEARAMLAAWWDENKAKLPACRRPGEPFPVLLDERGIVVGILDRAAVAPAVAGLRLVTT